MKILLISILFCLSACSYQYTAQQTNQLAAAVGINPHLEHTRLRQITLSPLDATCVSRGMFNDKSVNEKAFQQNLNAELLKSLQQRIVSVYSLNEIETIQNALASAKQQRCGLLVYPSVVKREDKVWSLMEWDTDIESWSDLGLDRLQLRMTVWDVNQGQVIDMAILSSQSAWFQIGKTTSDSLLAISINDYLDQLVALQ